MRYRQANIPNKRGGRGPDLPDFDALAPPMFCDPTIFTAKDKDEREVCNCVLALALAYNDLKDCYFAHDSLHNLPRFHSQQGVGLSSAEGQKAGMLWHSQRLLWSTLHELLNILDKNKGVWRHKIFLATLARTPRRVREDWRFLVDPAGQAPSVPHARLRSFLAKVRNNSGFHYHRAEAIGEGYEHYFDGHIQEALVPLASIGASMRETRFYFAEAGAEGLIEKWGVKDFKDAVYDAKLAIDRVMIALVREFVVVRGGEWKYLKP